MFTLPFNDTLHFFGQDGLDAFGDLCEASACLRRTHKSEPDRFRPTLDAKPGAAENDLAAVRTAAIRPLLVKIARPTGLGPNRSSRSLVSAISHCADSNCHEPIRCDLSCSSQFSANRFDRYLRLNQVETHKRQSVGMS